MANEDAKKDPRTAIGAMLRDNVIPKLVGDRSDVQDDPSDASSTGADKWNNAPVKRTIAEADIEETVDLLIAGKDDRVFRMVDELLAHDHTVGDLYLDFLSAAANKLGTRWTEDLCSFADVTLGMSTLHGILRSKAGLLANETEQTGDGLSILLAPMPGQTHVFGASVVEEFFRAAGWDVQSGMSDDETALIETVSEEHFDIVGLSVGHDSMVSQCQAFVARVRRRSLNPDVKIMVGGPVLALKPEHVSAMGADATAPDAREALHEAALLVPRAD